MFFIETFAKIKLAIEASKEVNRQRHHDAKMERYRRSQLNRQDMKIAYDTANKMSQDFDLQQFCWGPGAARNPAAQLRIAQEYENAGALMSALAQYEKAAKLGSAEAKAWVAQNKDSVRKAYLM